MKICEAEVFSGLLLLLWRYYAQKPIVFALSPLRLAQGSADIPPTRHRRLREPACRQLPGGGLCRRSRPFILKVTAEISVIAQISVIQVTVVSCVSVQKSAILLPKPPAGRGECQRCLAPSAGGRARIEWVYDTNAATKFATLHKKAGTCSKSNKFLLFSRYLRSPIGLLFL